ncbi:cytochrome P450 [Streptomyces sp. ADI93-02]|uniref:cytochrome P450 n=1 Tax=Streptomyces sp. ADI93-02 TaxID=1522757 RepID=UPI000FAAD255|nr:cytochrome P450 [Streptomyces sp. ADI93-02]RPK33305.1 Pentalenene oxygenase [Streptomyces sp. ADI93-02]
MLEEQCTLQVPVAPGGAPVFGHLFRFARDRANFLQDIRSAGDIVEMHLGRRSFYVLNAPESIHDVLVVQSRKFSKGMLFDRVRPFMGNGIATSDGPFHLRQRRALQPAFHRKHIAHYSEMFAGIAHQHVSRWTGGHVIEMDREMRKMAISMLVPTLFPSARDSATGQTIEGMGEHISGNLGVLVQGVLRATILPPALAAVPTPGRRRFLNSATALRRLADAAVKQARSDPEGHGVLALMLAHGEGDSGGMSDLEARDELLTFLVAGIETTSTTLSWALHVLARNQDMADRMSEEARTADPADITPAALPYTSRFIQEVLRMHQPLWFMGRRALEEVRLGQYELPRGAEVVYSAATLHRDPVYFPEPMRFDPDRWLRQPEKSLPRSTYIPFGSGSRKCIGDGFAWAELLAALSAITKKWHLHADPDRTVRTVADAQIHPDSLPISLTPRH